MSFPGSISNWSPAHVQQFADAAQALADDAAALAALSPSEYDAAAGHELRARVVHRFTAIEGGHFDWTP